MEEYDVIIIGGGINGLTCAAYLSKAGLKTIVLEARGECGAHCDTTEPGIPGFLHNLHATWLITPMSPAMGDLELSKFGLEFRTTDYVYAKTFEDGKNVLLGNNAFDTKKSWEKHSKKDASVISKAGFMLLNRLPFIIDTMHDFLFKAPVPDVEKIIGPLYEELFGTVGVKVEFDKLWKMNGFDVTDLMFESEHIKTTLQSLAWIGGFPPIRETVGSVGQVIMPLTGPIFPVHQAKGGSHSLTHSLVKAATAYGVTILPCCPVKEIIVEKGVAKGVILSENAIYPKERIMGKKIVSDLTAIPTFMDLVGEEHLGALGARIKKFDYHEQNLLGVYYALDGAPQFSSANYDEGIQRCFMGYFGGDTTEEMKQFNQDLIHRKIHDKIFGNWFVPSLADPEQAPEGGHTAFVWVDTPPAPKSWKNGDLNGLSAWDTIKYEMADQVTDTFEKFAPGFKKLIKDRIIYTPLDQQRNNPSAVLGNWLGGSMIAEQFHINRPVQGVLKGGSRTFIGNLYLSNSIHPFGATWLASGYIAADEVATDLGVRQQKWWNDKACMWYIDNMSQIPKNLGVR
ncbi:NAD(P)/FAD-dependent oxidoreductase [Deltaproteobacteria bacterium TL4]